MGLGQLTPGIGVCAFAGNLAPHCFQSILKVLNQTKTP